MPDCPPLRDAPLMPDAQDGRRVSYVRGLWASQDNALRQRDREIEGNVRMLCGQQWSVWSPLFGRYVDVTEYLSDDEKKFRQRPVVNRILPWFVLTLARMTENPPIMTFVPGPDAIDAQAAETLDTVWKALYRELAMPDAVQRLCAWLIVGGRSYAQTRIDLHRGVERMWAARAEVPIWDPETGGFVLGPDGLPVLEEHDDVPLGQDGQPVAVLAPDRTLIEFDEPMRSPEGGLVVDVMSALECRGEWGPTPWHQKAWHQCRSFISPEEAYERLGIEVEPDTTTIADTGDELRRLLFSAGFFGSQLERRTNDATRSIAGQPGGLCDLITHWERPRPKYPKGRLMVVNATKCLYDGPRPFKMPHTSPIRSFDFITVPGRVHGTTPQEAMNALQRAYNRGWAQILEHRNLVSNPIAILDKGSGLGDVQFTNEPGQQYEVTRRSGVPPVEYVVPPSLPADVWRAQEALRNELDDLGNLRGTEGAPPTDDASGELVKELRLNSDRFLGSTMRGIVSELGRMAEDWKVLLPIAWPMEKIVAYAGDDNVARTIVVSPVLFQEGNVNVIADAESMLPEGRGERQARVYKMWTDGVFGMPPQAPQAVAKYLALSRFPHLSRAAKPGGEDMPTAEQFLGAIAGGQAAAADLPWFPWYSVDVHLEVFTRFMKAPEFLRLDPAIQQQLIARWQMLTQEQQRQQMAAVQQALQLQAATAGATAPPSNGNGKKPGGDAGGAGSVIPPPASDSRPSSTPASRIAPALMSSMS